MYTSEKKKILSKHLKTYEGNWSKAETAFFPISELSYNLIRFLIQIPVVNSDNEIGKLSY